MKNDGTYFLNYGFNVKFCPPTVYPFEWEGIPFFTHRVAGKVINNEVEYSKLFWQVTHKDTGMGLEIENTMKIADAKNQAIGKLDKLGIDKVKEVIRKVMPA